MDESELVNDFEPSNFGLMKINANIWTTLGYSVATLDDLEFLQESYDVGKHEHRNKFMELGFIGMEWVNEAFIIVGIVLEETIGDA